MGSQDAHEAPAGLELWVRRGETAGKQTPRRPGLDSHRSLRRKIRCPHTGPSIVRIPAGWLKGTGSQS